MELNLNYKILNLEIEGCIDEENSNEWSFLENHTLNQDDLFEIYDEMNGIIITLNLINNQSNIYTFVGDCFDSINSQKIIFYLIWDKENNKYYTLSKDKIKKILPNNINNMLLKGLFRNTPNFEIINFI